jgi:F0F1-type ATP synthase membrane subunit b/b'
MSIEQIYAYSRIFMVCAVIFIILAVILFHMFDIKRIMKILSGKKIIPTHRIKQNIEQAKSNKTLLLTSPIKNTEVITTMDAS